MWKRGHFILHPLTAIDIAIEDSVTVSMGLLTNAVLRVMVLVRAEVRSLREGRGGRGREGGREGGRVGRREVGERRRERKEREKWGGR